MSDYSFHPINIQSFNVLLNHEINYVYFQENKKKHNYIFANKQINIFNGKRKIVNKIHSLQVFNVIGIIQRMKGNNLKIADHDQMQK